MHSLVMWGFALALVPLLMAVAWELVVVARAAISGHLGTKAPDAEGSREI